MCSCTLALNSAKEERKLEPFTTRECSNSRSFILEIQWFWFLKLSSTNKQLLTFDWY